MNVLKFKLLWEKLLETSAVYSFTHPHLGKLALVQPLLMQAILHRGAGRGNGMGDQPVSVLCAAGGVGRCAAKRSRSRELSFACLCSPFLAFLLALLFRTLWWATCWTMEPTWTPPTAWASRPSWSRSVRSIPR